MSDGLKEIEEQDRKEYNEWVQSLADEIEFDPLKEFILKLTNGG